MGIHHEEGQNLSSMTQLAFPDLNWDSVIPGKNEKEACLLIPATTISPIL